MFLKTSARRTSGCPFQEGHQTRLDGALGKLVGQEISGPMERVEAGWCLRSLPTSAILWFHDWCPFCCLSLQKLSPQYLMQSLPLLLQSPKSWEQKNKNKNKNKPQTLQSPRIISSWLYFPCFFPPFLCIWRTFEVSFHCPLCRGKAPRFALEWTSQNTIQVKYRKCDPRAVQKGSKTLLQISTN